MTRRLSAPGCQLLALCALSLSASTVWAQQQITTGVAVERFIPAVGPSSLVGVEGAAVTPAGAVSWVASLDVQHDPITLKQAYTGAVVTRPVVNQLVADLALEFGIWKRLALAVGVPVVLYQTGDRLRGTGVDERGLVSTTAGDLRVRLKASLVGGDGGGLNAAIILQVTAPTAGQSDFAGTDGATVEPRLVVDAHLFGRLTLAATLGARFAKERTLFFTQFGDELVWSAGLAVALYEGQRFGLGAILENAGAVGPSDGTRPVELRGALRGRLGPVVVDAGAGGGLDRDVGAPAWRVFLVARGTLGLARSTLGLGLTP